MQLILDCFKRIFEALAGIYTKQESDAQLAVKADKAEVEAEANARQEADATLANVVKWQSYAAAMQGAVDEITAAQIAEEFGRATVEYLENPTAMKEWYTSSTTESTNPYYSEKPIKPIVDFNVVKVSRGAVAVGSFNSNTDVPLFFPNVIDFQSACYLLRVLNSPVYIGKCELLVQGFYNATKFNQYVYLGNCNDARLAFYGTSMSANNIAATLNSLKTQTDGKSHLITFSKSKGIASTSSTETFTSIDENGVSYRLENCPVFTSDDENSTLRKAYVLAVAKKGWTVEI